MMMVQLNKDKIHPASRHAARLTVIVAALVILAICAVNSSGNQRAKPSVILLSVDTLRADRMSGYGYDRHTTPALDALMNQGIRFEDVLTTIPLTNPSFTSTMTSRYAHETGATRNGLPMDADFVTLAQLFKSAGYQTGAVVSNWPLRSEICAMNAGFDYYDQEFKSKRNLMIEEQDARDVTDLALEWFDRIDAKKPFFAWIHYSDPHAPYHMRRQFQFKVRRGEKKDTPTYKYDTEVAYTDFHIGRLLKGLLNRGIKNDTLIVFFSDHGESLGEHGYVGHGRHIYRQMLWVPLAIEGPGIKSKVVSREPVSLLDIMPTVLTYAGLAVPSGARGHNLLTASGEPAAGLWQARYFETYRGAVPDVAGAKKMLPGTKPLRLGMQEGNWKIIHSPEDNSRELFDIAADPLELKELSSTHLEKTAVMTRLTWEWFQMTKPLNPPRVRLIPPDVRKKLEALGYLQ